MFLAGLVVGSLATVIVNFILVKVIVKNEGKDDYFKKLAEKELDKQNNPHNIIIVFVRFSQNAKTRDMSLQGVCLIFFVLPIDIRK